MKTLFILAASLAAGSAFASWHGLDPNGPTRAQIYSRHMSCAAVQNSVSSNGAVILHYGRDLYDRVVATGAYCFTGQTTEPYWAPTSDNAECFVGYLCVDQGGNGG